MKGNVSIDYADKVLHLEEIEENAFENWMFGLTNTGLLQVTSSVDHKRIVIPIHAIRNIQWAPVLEEGANGSTN